MKTNLNVGSGRNARRNRGMTIVELLLGLGIGSIVLATVAVLIVFAARGFAALANYQVLDQASSHAADTMSREIREGARVVSFVNTGNSRHIVFSNSIASSPYSVRYEWTSASRNLTMRRSFDAAPSVLLTGCDRWDFAFYQRTPLPGPGYGFSKDMANKDECKLVTMTWKCSRPIFSTTLFNTESIQTAQIVLRNQRTP